MKKDYQHAPHDPSSEEVNFDVTRMRKAIEEGQRFVMPERMQRENFREWMRENASKCRTK